MRVLVVLLIGGFAIGGTRAGQRLREKPLLLLPLATVAAGSFYLLRVVM